MSKIIVPDIFLVVESDYHEENARVCPFFSPTWNELDAIYYCARREQVRDCVNKFWVIDAHGNRRSEDFVGEKCHE